MRWRSLLLVSFAVLVSCVGTGFFLFNIPGVYERIDWYVDSTYTRVYRAINPPEDMLFVPQERVEAIVRETLEALTPTAQSPPTATEEAPAATRPPLSSATPLPSPTPIPSPTTTATPTQLPGSVALSGVRNEIETRNNCGPATLAMALSYWGWQGDQTVTRGVLRPNLKVDDKNVMPAEMAAYVHDYTNLGALVRSGGDHEMLKSLIAAGFPVIVEKGHTTTGWIGHYILLTGYDDSRGVFLSQDSLIVSPDSPVPYDELARWWRHFNYLYIVIYPFERQDEVLSILGPHADIAYNFLSAAEKALQEIPLLSGRALFFAWYNLGSSLAGLGSYQEAASAFDTAYSEVYPNISREERPWRALWYQTGPYLAYYSTGRYQDVIRLAETTLAATGSPILEETFYWRGMAREASGDLEGAIADFKKAAELNRNSTPAVEKLRQLGVEAP